MYVGIDGCKAGWIIVGIENNYPVFNIVNNINNQKSLLNKHLSLIDIPIGLSEKSIRDCDIQAKKILKPFRHNSVFMIPVRAAVYALSYKEACNINQNNVGKKISIQAWSLTTKIKEIDEFIINNPEYNLRESHPEVCFWALNNNSSCHFSKKNKVRIKERFDIIDATVLARTAIHKVSLSIPYR